MEMANQGSAFPVADACASGRDGGCASSGDVCHWRGVIVEEEEELENIE